MAFMSSPGGRGPLRRKATAAPMEDDRSRLTREQEEVRRLEREILKREEEARRRLEELPKKLEERERKQKEMQRLRAVATATYADGVGLPRAVRQPGRSKAQGPRRMTRPEERSAKIQFFVLCAILAFFLFLLWRSLP